ncbi:hypothetical protein KSF78_0002300 [Schistosoma japonicum]|nr:hypothetical protein KSF78_0002285 [Schistosoma japonicum]KAH8856157.1 hypothetical protein KSF78_0002300 [Schistosoma japonicum]
MLKNFGEHLLANIVILVVGVMMVGMNYKKKVLFHFNVLKVMMM